MLCFSESESAEKPRILWSLFFDLEDTSQVQATDNCPSNLHIIGGPDASLDCDLALQQVGMRSGGKLGVCES